MRTRPTHLAMAAAIIAGGAIMFVSIVVRGVGAIARMMGLG